MRFVYRSRQEHWHVARAVDSMCRQFAPHCQNPEPASRDEHTPPPPANREVRLDYATPQETTPESEVDNKRLAAGCFSLLALLVGVMFLNASIFALCAQLNPGGSGVVGIVGCDRAGSGDRAGGGEFSLLVHDVIPVPHPAPVDAHEQPQQHAGG
jgi:hypothetical protein